MKASTSASASSMSVASFGTLGRSWSATERHCVRAASASSWTKGRADEGGDDATALPSGVGEHVAHET